MRTILTLVALAASIAPLAAVAQSAVDTDITPESAAPKSAPGRTDNVLNGVEFSLDISEDDSEASIQYGQTRTRTASSGDKQVSTSWLIKGSVPVGGGDDLTSKGTLDALSNGPKVTVRLSFLSFSSASPQLRSGGFLPLMVDALKACNAELAKGEKVNCNYRPDLPDATFAQTWLSRRVTSFLYPKVAVRGGIEGSIGVKRFPNIEPVTLIERNPAKPQFAASGFLTLYPSDKSTTITARVEYQNAFEADDETILCKPVIVTPASDCKKGVPMAPHNVEQINLSLAVTKAFTFNKSFSFGIAPKATVDAIDGKWGVEVPFYLIPPASWPIAPAVVVSYSSKDDKFDAALVLRKTFSF